MKSRKLTCIIVVTLLAAVTPMRLTAQDKANQHHAHHHYKFIDMGTLGGPQSYTFATFGVTATRVLNRRGTIAGFADTATTDPFPDFCFTQDCFVTHAFQWQNAGMVDLGVLPGGSSSASTFVSASGLIAGFSQNGKIDPLFSGFPEARAVLWNHGRVRNLGTLANGHESVSNAVNSRGQVVGGALNTIPDSNAMTLSVGLGQFFPPIPYQVRAFLWHYGAMQDLGTLSGGTDAQAVLINEAGQVAGWSYTSSAPSAVCAAVGFPLTTGSFLWEKNKGMVDLGNLGGSCTLLSDLNSHGQVAGSSFLAGDSFEHAFLWDGLIHDLKGSFGGNQTGAAAMNDRGQVVGFATYSGDVTFHAALWKHVGKITDLGTVGNDACSFAGGINEKTQVVGGSKFTCDPESGLRAFLWEHGSIFDLNALIPQSSALYLQSADNINDRGEITGQGVDASGNTHAFLLIPCDETHSGVNGCDYNPVDAAEETQSPVRRYIPSGVLSSPRRRRGNPYRMPALKGSDK